MRGGPGPAAGIDKGRQAVWQLGRNVEGLSTDSGRSGALEEGSCREHGVHGMGFQDIGELRKRAFDEGDLVPIDALPTEPFARHDVEEASEARGSDLLADEIFRLLYAGSCPRNDAVIGVVD